MVARNGSREVTLHSNALVLLLNTSSRDVNIIHDPRELIKKSRQLGLLFNFEFSTGNYKFTGIVNSIYMSCRELVNKLTRTQH